MRPTTVTALLPGSSCASATRTAISVGAAVIGMLVVSWIPAQSVSARGDSPYDWSDAKLPTRGTDAMFHDRFVSDLPLQTLRFYSDRIESEHMTDPDHLYGNFLVVGEQQHQLRNRSLYTLTSDPDGGSVCTGPCAEAWPPFMVNGPHSLRLPSGFPGDVDVIARTDPDGFQVTLNGRPLYRYAPDEAPGETRGHLASNGAWRLIVVSSVTSDPPSDIDPDDHSTWFRGLNAWRMPRPQIGACVNCHAPDAYDIARVGFTDEDIMRRAVGDGLGEAEGQAIVDLVDLQRHRHHMVGDNSPFDPDHFRPLQPGNFPLEGDSDAERDLAFAVNLRETHGLKLVSERIDTLADTLAARDELVNLDLNTVRIGIPFDRFSEDPHHGAERNTFHDWIPFAPHEVRREHNEDWYALQDAYILDPTPHNLRALIAAIDEYTTTCRFLVNHLDPEDCDVDDGIDPSDPYGPYASDEPVRSNPPEAENPRLTRRWNLFRYRNILLLQHMMREENQRTHEHGMDSAGLMYYPTIHPSDETYASWNYQDVYDHIQLLNRTTAIWDVGEAVGRMNWFFDTEDRSNDPQIPMAFRSRLGYEQVFDSPLNNAYFQSGRCRGANRHQYKEFCYWRAQHQGLRATWFWMGLIQDPEFLFTKSSLEYFHQTYQQVQDYRLHSVFGTFVTQMHRSFRHDTRYRGAGPHSHYEHRGVRHLNDRLLIQGQMMHFAPTGWMGDLDEERLAEFRLMAGNIARMMVWLIYDDLDRTGQIIRRDRAENYLGRLRDHLLDCARDDPRFCLEEEAHRATTGALLDQVDQMLAQAEQIEANPDRIRLGTPEAEAARFIHGEHNRWGVGEYAIGVAPPALPRRVRGE